MTESKKTGEKRAWEDPTATVVAMTSNVQGSMGMDTDEDFFGLPS